MQNVNYFGVMMKCKMAKFLGSCLVPSKMQNLGFLFFCLLRLKYKIENNHLFAKKICMLFSSILQNDEPNPFFFEKKRELNTP